MKSAGSYLGAAKSRFLSPLVSCHLLFSRDRDLARGRWPSMRNGDRQWNSGGLSFDVDDLPRGKNSPLKEDNSRNPWFSPSNRHFYPPRDFISAGDERSNGSILASNRCSSKYRLLDIFIQSGGSMVVNCDRKRGCRIIKRNVTSFRYFFFVPHCIYRFLVLSLVLSFFFSRYLDCAARFIPRRWFMLRSCYRQRRLFSFW